jgi:pyrimidine-specific ribonucleoside hydrolase
MSPPIRESADSAGEESQMKRNVFTSRSIGIIIAGLAVCTVAVVALVHEPQEVQLVAFFLPVLAIWYLQSKSPRNARLSWQLPLTGYALTFAIGAGMSASNRDIRTEAELVGSGVLAVCTWLGFLYSYKTYRHVPNEKPPRWRRDAVAGLVSNLLLAGLALFLAHESYEAKHQPIPARTTSTDEAANHPQRAGQVPVWIDTDPACGVGTTADVDDCWALLAAARSPELEVRGISTVFGNQDGRKVHRFAEDLMARLAEAHRATTGPLDVYAGSTTRGDSAWPATPASHALASALEEESLVIIALGPLTNIATLIKTHPELTARIERIVLVGGKRPGQLFHPGHQWWFHFGDFNIAQDPDAAETVLYSGVPITLVPFELATKLVVTESDLERLRAGDGAARWLSEVSEPWLSFWNTMLGKPGFHPFDVLAVVYAAMPEHFQCKRVPARIGFNLFLEPFGMGRDLEVAEHLRGPVVTDCYDLDRAVKDVVLIRIMGEPHESFEVSRAM